MHLESRIKSHTRLAYTLYIHIDTWKNIKCLNSRLKTANALMESAEGEIDKRYTSRWRGNNKQEKLEKIFRDLRLNKFLFILHKSVVIYQQTYHNII